MRAQTLARPAPIDAAPLVLVDLPSPQPRPDEILVAVSACGVCRTDLHIAEGDLPFLGGTVVPGHEVVGQVAALGEAVTRFQPGERVGVAWVNRFCGNCEPCIEGQENLCRAPSFTGYHVPGGYAELLTVPAAFAHPIPATLGEDLDVAPLLCAGIIGYRALKRADLRPGQRLGLYGFGGSAHIALQVARAWGCEVFVHSRSPGARERALAMGAAWAGLPEEPPPRPVHGGVYFAPAGAGIPAALEALRPGGTLALAGIYLDRIPGLDYDRHLAAEKRLASVTANTRADARELLDLAARLAIQTDVVAYDLADANAALLALKEGRLAAQAAVLRVGDGST